MTTPMQLRSPEPDAAGADLADPSQLAKRYRSIRQLSERITAPLSAEDCAIQSMPDVSPMRWHLAHTTWFFETFLLKATSGYRVFDSSFEYLFNSYYNTLGEQFPRAKRGLISRPGLQQTLQYRSHVDRAMSRLIEQDLLSDQQRNVLAIGLNHEQQHQELMLTDIKHVLSCNPLMPAYEPEATLDSGSTGERGWVTIDEGVVWIGHEPQTFVFDNETPRHRHFLEATQIATHCVTNAEYLDFINDGGYQTPQLWLSAGWQTVQDQKWSAPMYWVQRDGQWQHFTLAGCKPINPDQPVCHVSYFEADAYARWAGHRLPTEFEWEHAVMSEANPNESPAISGHWSDKLLGAGLAIEPQISKGDAAQSRLCNAFGNLWEWTSSQYTPYPGFQPPDGALGEYNGKFMCNQFVLRGGSCATPSDHIRPTYRNFFPPDARWQFFGIRLAKQIRL